MTEKKSELKDEQFDIEEFRGRNAGALLLGVAIGVFVLCIVTVVILICCFWF